MPPWMIDRFLSRLPERLARLRSLATRSSDAECVAQIQHEFHGIVGIGGTYGFNAMSDVAARGEDACSTARAMWSRHDAAALKRDVNSNITRLDLLHQMATGTRIMKREVA